jgi:hypothetical protein
MHLINILSIILKTGPFYCPGLDESKKGYGMSKFEILAEETNRT